MILDIVKYGDPLLTKTAEEVTLFDQKLRKLVDDMFETMYGAPGVGLAAPQVGVLKRLFVMDCSSGKDKRQKVALVNPVIETEEGEQIGDEGCLSFPGIFIQVARPQRLVVRAQDVDGSPLTMDVMDLEARCISHETDHLDGELFIYYLSPLKRDLMRRKIKKRIKLGDWYASLVTSAFAKPGAKRTPGFSLCWVGSIWPPAGSCRASVSGMITSSVVSRLSRPV